MWEIMYSRTGYRWKYGACAFDAGYPRLQTHIQRCHAHCFSTATVVARMRLIVTLCVHGLPCCHIYSVRFRYSAEHLTFNRSIPVGNRKAASRLLVAHGVTVAACVRTARSETWHVQTEMHPDEPPLESPLLGRIARVSKPSASKRTVAARIRAQPRVVWAHLTQPLTLWRRIVSALFKDSMRTAQ